MEYRRPILQEMDTQEYDWVRLYIEKSPAKLYYCLAGDSGQERFIYVLTKQTRSKLDFDWISIRASAYPMPSEFFKIISCLSLARVCDIEFLALLHLI